MVEIKKETCIGCGACVRDCPGNALRMTDERAEVIRPCIQCGHCVAICPVNAVAIPEYDMEEVEAYERSTFAIDPVQYLHAVKFRRSIRNYKDIPLERDKVQRILDACLLYTS